MREAEACRQYSEDLDAQKILIKEERQAKEEVQTQAEEAEQMWSEHQAAQRLITKEALARVAELESSQDRRQVQRLTRRVAELEKQLEDDRLEQVWLTTFAVSRNVAIADAESEGTNSEEAENTSPNLTTTRTFRPPREESARADVEPGHKYASRYNVELPGAALPVQTQHRAATSGGAAGTPCKLRRPHRSNSVSL